MIKTPYNSRISKVYEEEYLDLFQKLFKNKKKDKKKIIKAVTSKELGSSKKLNKRKRRTTDREYSKNDSMQSVDIDMEAHDSNNYMVEGVGKKLEILDSRDDQTSEYRTMTDTDFTMIHTSYNSRIAKVHKEGYPELILKLLKNKKREQKNDIKAVTRKEILSPEKSNKRKQAATDKEYSKNDSLQSVDMDMEAHDSNNYMVEGVGKKLEILDSRDDQTSEYRTMTDTGMYLGQYCNQTFNNVNGVHSHENVLTGNTPLQCDVCFKTFSCKSKLHIHERTHTGEKPYACDVCGRSFTQKINLVSHTRTHSGEKPYACNVCGRSFSMKGNLVTHTRTHSGEKPYACNVCGRSFSMKGHLVTHTRTHTGEKPYACNVCCQSFSHKSTLVNHTRTHTGERPYACDVCGRSFSERSTFIVHYRIHTGERPYECGHCEKKFSKSSHCARHTRNVHFKYF
ncbi:unnamed protein product [Macrosiphum euphorbiae]|uniref:C2H2-type domain-containing protein n=1 Tax=Macrosiphum euphorbiae TaxID=13131 RepID=A0AAV0XC16_9HEMI|nr:unnamed protein product [Macrosiphum euphorbiae]